MLTCYVPFLGRIFTKFSESKMLALNEVGIHNVINLFLTLAISGDLKAIVSSYLPSICFPLSTGSSSFQYNQLQNILLMLRLEKLPAQRQACVVKGHMALIMLITESRLDASAYIVRMLEQINRLPVDENKTKALRVIADACESLLSRPDIFECGEFALIGNWRAQALSMDKIMRAFLQIRGTRII